MQTYGDSLSPILAHFQKIPKTPVLFLSMKAGRAACKYVEVQINKMITCKREEKLKRADYLKRKIEKII